MLYNKGNHAKFKCVQPQPSPLQDENGGKIHQTWNFGCTLSIKLKGRLSSGTAIQFSQWRKQ
jgi:hypothetical protein